MGAAAAIPLMPMMIGAGAGALISRDNPMKGALLGALGGGIAGPALGALGSAAGASGAAGAGLGAAAELPHLAGMGAAGMAGAGGVSPLATMGYGAALAPSGVGGQQAAMLAAQTGGMEGGLAHTMGSFSAPGAGLFDKGMGMLGGKNPMKMMQMAGQMFGSPNQAPPPMPVRPYRPSSQAPAPIIRYKTFV